MIRGCALAASVVAALDAKCQPHRHMLHALQHLHAYNLLVLCTPALGERLLYKLILDSVSPRKSLVAAVPVSLTLTQRPLCGKTCHLPLDLKVLARPAHHFCCLPYPHLRSDCAAITNATRCAEATYDADPKTLRWLLRDIPVRLAAENVAVPSQQCDVWNK